MPRPRSPYDATIVARHAAGEGATEIARSLNVSTALVHKALRRNGAAPGRLKISTEIEQAIVQRYTAGDKAEAILADLGITKSTVYTALHRNGIEPRRQWHSLTSDQENEIIQRFDAGEAVLVIARDYPVHQQTIHNMLKKRGVKDPKAHLDADTRTLVICECANGSNIPDAARTFGISESTVTRILREHRENGGVIEMPQGRPPVCEIDHHAFDALTPESLYWHGFLWADGNLHVSKWGSPTLNIGLAKKDEEHLKKLRTFLKSTHAITQIEARPVKQPDDRIINGGPAVYLSVRSKQIFDALSARGMVTKAARIPAPELATSRDFWRGMIDGDGCIGSSEQRGRFYPTFKLAGQHALLDVFRGFISQVADLQLSPTKRGIFTVGTTGSKAETIIRLLYENAGIALDRKLARARAIIAGDVRRFPSYDD